MSRNLNHFQRIEIIQIGVEIFTVIESVDARCITIAVNVLN